jgi:hypothetical protein
MCASLGAIFQAALVNSKHAISGQGGCSERTK